PHPGGGDRAALRLRPRLGPRPRLGHMVPPGRVGAVAAVAAAVIIAGSALAVADLGAHRADQRFAFSQLWMLPAGKGQAQVVDLGILSHERTARSYRLVVEAGGHTLRSWPSIRLRPGQQWEASAVVPAFVGRSEEISAVLYLAGRAGPYRHVDVPPGTVG
ncbi:MAG: hypothetical protein ACRD0L_01350, partial [Acidimicrobiales bacterium]